MNFSDIILRLSFSLLIGGVVGYERSNRNSSAGLRTHILVSVSMTMVSLIQISMFDFILKEAISNPEYAFLLGGDIGRLPAQAISGIGFIGAGTILHQRSTIVGLTTAASIWAVGITGLAIGMGYFLIAGVGGIFIVVTLDTLSYFQTHYINKPHDVQLNIKYRKNDKVPEAILMLFNEYNFEIRKVIYVTDVPGSDETIKYLLHITSNINIDTVIRKIYYTHPAITSVEKYGN